DDHALALPDHHLERASRCVPISGQADVDALAPLLQRHLADASGVKANRVVVQDVEAAELVDRELDHALDLSRIADVGAKRLGPASAAANFTSYSRRAFLVQIDYDDRGTLGREPLCSRFSNSRSRTRNKCNPVF